MTVSVIIPTYNSAATIEEAVCSVIAQTYIEWELIIVDDGSVDNTIQMALDYANLNPKIRFYERNRYPKGGSVCRNIGAELATGEYLIFLDSDDTLMEGCLQLRVAAMETEEQYPFGVFPTGTAPGSPDAVFPQLTECKENYLYQFIISSPPWQTTSAIWKHDFFSSIGGFDERFERLQDVEIFLTALLKVGKDYYVHTDNDRDYIFNLSDKTTSKSFLYRFFGAHDLFYEKVSIVATSEKTRMAIVALLVEQYGIALKLSNPHRLRLQSKRLKSHIDSNFTPSDYYIFRICGMLGKTTFRAFRGYMMARCFAVIYDRPRAIHLYHFSLWVIYKNHTLLKRWLR